MSFFPVIDEKRSSENYSSSSSSSSNNATALGKLEFDEEDSDSNDSKTETFSTTLSVASSRDPIPPLSRTFSSTRQMLQMEEAMEGGGVASSSSSYSKGIGEELYGHTYEQEGIGNRHITFNPLNKPAVVTQAQVEQKILQLLGLTKQQKYCSGQLSHELAYLAARKTCPLTLFNAALEAVLPTISANKTSRKYLLQELVELLSYEFGVEVVRKFFKDNSGFLEPFAELAFSRWKKERSLIQCLQHLTMLDLQEQTFTTMLRDTSLSSFLCSRHGKQLLQKELKGIIDCIEDNFKRIKLRECVVRRELIRQELEKDSAFQKGEESEQDSIIEEVRGQNAANLSRMLIPILEYIYKIHLPAACVELLKVRRECVSEHLMRAGIYDKHKQRVEVMVGELLFLRIIEPAIINAYFKGSSEKKEHAEKKDIILNLARVLQKLSNQTPFDNDDKDPVVDKLNELYQVFSEKQQYFIFHHSS